MDAVDPVETAVLGMATESGAALGRTDGPEQAAWLSTSSAAGALIEARRRRTRASRPRHVAWSLSSAGQP